MCTCYLVPWHSENTDGIGRKDKGDMGIPVAGMVFESMQSAMEFCKAYGKGYPRSKKPRKGSIFALQKARCKAKMSLVRSGEEDGKYIINKVMLANSHDLSPSKGKYFRCNRGISLGVRRTLEINDNAGIRVCNNYTSIVQEYGGVENMRFTE
ncbi:hypothetical protein SLA2020_207060 [Shorea laevis]